MSRPYRKSLLEKFRYFEYGNSCALVKTAIQSARQNKIDFLIIGLLFFYVCFLRKYSIKSCRFML